MVLGEDAAGAKVRKHKSSKRRAKKARQEKRRAAVDEQDEAVEGGEEEEDDAPLRPLAFEVIEKVALIAPETVSTPGGGSRAVIRSNVALKLKAALCDGIAAATKMALEVDPRHVGACVGMMPDIIADYEAANGVFPNPSFILRKARESAWRAEGWLKKRKAEGGGAAKKKKGKAT